MDKMKDLKRIEQTVRVRLVWDDRIDGSQIEVLIQDNLPLSIILV